MRFKSIYNLVLAFMLCSLIGCGESSSESTEEVMIIKERGVAGLSNSGAGSSGSIASDMGEATVGVKDEDSYEPDLGVWYPYWDYDTADKELEQIGSELNTLCFFAAYFDKNSKPFIPQTTLSTKKTLEKSGELKGRTTYLTFVNDKLLDQGSSLKDTELLYELFSDTSKASEHADEILKMCRTFGSDGIEIDYEAIKKDSTLWGHFNHFIKVLSEKAQAAGMPLRVVFEPSAPLEEYQWPEYPEYVMMCYNLYGYGTTPGPKANIEWLQELSERMKQLPGNINMAFATGGFDFSSDGQVSQINYSEAIALLDQYKADGQRDQESQALSFIYTDASGLSHEVWYSDRETIKAWKDTVNSCGIPRISIWRLGGNIS